MILFIPGWRIRNIPELQSQVEKLVSQVQQRAPSLDRETSPGVDFTDQKHEDEVVVEQFVYKYGEDGTHVDLYSMSPSPGLVTPHRHRAG